MADSVKIRKLLEALNIIAVHLTDDEVDQIALVLYRASVRLEKESVVEE